MKNAPKKASRSLAGNSSRKSAAVAAQPSFNRDNLRKIFEDSLKDIYWAEKHLTKALPKMSKAAYDEDLKAAFDEHLQQTEGQVERLDQVFEQLGKKAQGKKCPAMEGLVEEGQEAVQEYDAGYGRDAALIVSAQKIEHYEIAAYGSLKAQATVMGEDEIAALLDETLQEESETDEKLTGIAGSVNEMAYNEGEESATEEVEEEDTEDVEEEDKNNPVF
jgi:ferritin-like metal-binding protein YciE